MSTTLATWLAALPVAAYFAGATIADPPPNRATCERPADVQDALLDARVAVTTAAYEGDLDELARWADVLGEPRDDAALGWLSDYHAGFAHFVLALMVGPNGLVSQQGDAVRMGQHVDAGIRELEQAVEARPDFADALALLSHLYAMKIRRDPQRLAPELGPQGRELLANALALEPNNPRVVLIEAMRLFWAPPAAGGDRERGLARWSEARALFERETERGDSPLPTWGHAEAWAWLPGALLALQPPDVARAERAARRALEIRPDFRWVRASLMPSIEAARAGAAG